MNWFVVRCTCTILFCLNQRILCLHENLTQVCITQGVEHTNTKDSWVFYNGSSFREIIKNNVFIDKSLLLEQALSRDSLIDVIVGPHKWGKSVNLDMIEFFADIERNKNGTRIPKEKTAAYRYFVKGEISTENGEKKLSNPPLISTLRHFIEENLANYAVIRLDLKDMPISKDGVHPEAGSFAYELKKRINVIIEKYTHVFEKLLEMINNHEKANKANQTGPVTQSIHYVLKDYMQFRKFVQGGTKPVEVLRFIEFLSGVIMYHFQERVLILIDHYDDVLNQLFFDSYIRSYTTVAGVEIQEYFNNILGFVLRGNHYFVKAVVTGTLKQSRSIATLGTEHSKIYHIPDALRPFYGITEQELQHLLKLRGMSEEHNNIAVHRYGYRTINHQEQIFSPWAIFKFLRHHELVNVWSGSDIIVNKTLPHLFKYYPFKTAMEWLLNRNSQYSVQKVFLKKANWIYDIAQLIRGNYTSVVSNHVDGILSWLYSLGYLSGKQVQQSDKVLIFIANDDVRAYIASTMKTFYRSQLRENFQLLVNSGSSLQLFLGNDGKTSEKFEQDIRELLADEKLHASENEIKDWMERVLNSWKYYTHIRELTARSLIRKMLTLLQIDDKLEVKMSHKCQLPDTEAHEVTFFGSHEKRAIIIQLMGPPSTINQTLEQAVEYTLRVKDEIGKFDVVKYVAINVPESGPIHFASDMKRMEEIEIFILTHTLN